MEGNKGHYFCSGNLKKKPNFDLSKNHEYAFLYRVENSQFFYVINSMTFSKFA